MSKLGERAVVCGAGMGGLLAARVLSEFYGTVTLVERDKLPDGVSPRRGVPQGPHFHSLLSRGSQELDGLFPGLLDELVAAGATVCDDGDLSRLSIRVGGHEFNRSGKFADPTAVVLYLLSRPLLESHVRRRVCALDNVEILDGHDVVEPIAQPQRVTGAQVVNRDTNAWGTLDADLVVDSMGRAPRTPAFLDSLGYGRPAEQRSVMGANYCSQLLRIPADMITEKLTYVIPEPERPTGGAVSTYEHDTWILTIGCMGEQEPPGDLAGMIALAARFVSPALLAALHAGEPLGEMAIFGYRGGFWRRYDKMPRFPAGLLVFGDAICSTNPIYGQGMTVAILEAVALRECLSQAGGDLSRRFFDAAARLIDPIWAYDQTNDACMSDRDGQTPEHRQLLDLRDELLTAAESSTAMTESFFRVMHLIDPPKGSGSRVR
ncbi:MAG: FAD-dependent oxidoreductase [Mycobacterium sp.]